MKARMVCDAGCRGLMVVDRGDRGLLESDRGGETIEIPEMKY